MIVIGEYGICMEDQTYQLELLCGGCGANTPWVIGHIPAVVI